MKIRFTITEYDTIAQAEAKGILQFIQNSGETTEFKAVSGGWGKGPLEPGEYKIKYLTSWADISKLKDKDAYAFYDSSDIKREFGFGFFASLEPTFETSRTGLGVHIDGNVPGTLGCIGVVVSTINEAILCYNLIRDAMEIQGSIDVTVEYVGGRDATKH